MTTYIGIDPGLDGAVVAILPNYEIGEGPGWPSFDVTPTIYTGNGGKREYNVPAMAGILRAYINGGNNMNVACALERSQPMPGQGVTSMFSIGKGYGIWLGLLTALEIPFEVVHPVKWSKAMTAGVPGEPKARNLIVVQRLFPRANLLATERSRKPHEGIVDALLIAEWLRRSRNGGAQ